MKAYFKILIGFLVQVLVVQTVFGQTKKSSDSVFINAQIKPKFSEMADYGLPNNREGVHELPGGKAPVSYQINLNGSIRNNKTGEITVPAEIVRTTEQQKTTEPNAGSDDKTKSKRKKN